MVWQVYVGLLNLWSDWALGPREQLRQEIVENVVLVQGLSLPVCWSQSGRLQPFLGNLVEAASEWGIKAALTL